MKAKTKTAYRVRGAFSFLHDDGSRTWFTRRNESALAQLPAPALKQLVADNAIEEYQALDDDAPATPAATASTAPDSEAGQLDQQVRDQQNAANADAGASSTGAAKTSKRGR
jgi:hypothetical protein